MPSDPWGEPQRFPLRGALAELPTSPATLTAVVGALRDDPRIALVAVGIAVLQVARYLRRRWWLDGEAIHLHTGLINITRRTASLDRVQQVDVRQGAMERLLALGSTVVETASGAREADLKLILPVEEARALQAHLMKGRHVPHREEDADTESVEEPAPTSDHGAARHSAITISSRELAIAGLSGAELWAGLAAAGTLVQRALDFVPGLDGTGDEVTSDLGGLGVVAVTAAAITYLAVVSMLGGMALSVIRFGDYTLDDLGDRIRVRRGLFARNEESTPVARIQVVAVEQTFLRRRLQRAAMQLRAAGTGDDESQDRLRVPIWPADGVADLADRLVPGLGSALSAPLRPAPPAARRRALLRAGAVGTSVMAISATALAFVEPVLVLLSPVVLALALLFGRAAWEALGLGLTHGHVSGRAGVITRRTQVVPRDKVQSVRVRSSPFQRRRGLANLHVDVASTASVIIVDRTLDEATEVAGELVA